MTGRVPTGRTPLPREAAALPTSASMVDGLSLRIGLFTNNFRPLVNRLATSVETFARDFLRAGHRVTIVAPRYAEGYRDDDDVIRVPGLRAPTHHAYVLPVPFWPGVRRAVLGRNLDVYHAQHPFLPGAAAARWANATGRPRVFTYHTRYDRYVDFIGSLPGARVTDYALAADLFLFPSTSETQGLAALEALAAGLPVIAVVSEAAADLLPDESAGILCPEDPGAYAGCVAALWAAPARRAVMAEAARRIAARFTPEASAARLLGLYGELVRARRPLPAGVGALHPREVRT